jgi:ribosomal protein S18 acetylase RimI-like enzyme/2'-5' RNA ligase
MITGRLADEIDGLRRALGSTELERIAPHITLVPPVNVHETEVEGACEVLRAAVARSGPLAVHLGPPATFFPPNPVCYLRVSGDVAGLASLREGMQVAPLAPPEGRERRPFVPHVTIRQKMPPERIAPTLEILSPFEASHCFESLTLIELDQAARRWNVLTEARLEPPHIAGRGGLEIELSVSGRLDPETRKWAHGAWAHYLHEEHGESVREDEDFAVTARVRHEPDIAGMADGQIRWPVCHLAHVIVAPQWRSYGVGSQLLRAVTRVASEHHCDRIRLLARAGKRAEGFYRERGYAVVASLPRWRGEENFVMMERPLEAPPA